MIGLLLVPSEVCMNEELGEILNLIGSRKRNTCRVFKVRCDDVQCYQCSLSSAHFIKNSNDYYVAQIGKVNHELRYSNSSGTDVQPEPRKTSN